VIFLVPRNAIKDAIMAGVMNDGAGGGDACGFCSYVRTSRDDDGVNRPLLPLQVL
jgi:hypothetical protein